MQRRASRAQRRAVTATAVMAASTTGYLLGSLVAGYAIPVPVLVVVLLAGWLCIVALVVLPALDGSAPTAWLDPTRTGAGDGLRGGQPASGGRLRDPITGLPRYEPERDDRYVTRTDHLPGSVIVVEIVDHVAASAISPTVADRLVADAAARVATTGSMYDAVVRRLDGPRLALLLPGLDEPALMALAGTLHDATTTSRLPRTVLDEPGMPGLPVRLVAGVAIADGDAADVATLIRSASTAAAQGKRRGNESPVVFHDGLAGAARERLVVGRALRTAIDERNISLVFQPQVDLADGSLLGVEVLARWHDPALGTIGPERFVEVAAEIGMSWQLDRLIFEKAFAQLADWDATGVDVPRILLNATPQTIADGRRVALPELLASYRINPDRVTIEIVDSGHFDVDRGRAAIEYCRRIGVDCTLDHVGENGASFGPVTKLPVTGIKLHRSLLAEDADSAELAAIIRTGTSLGLAVAAVGIETGAQRELLRQMGCAAGQGYLFAPPLTAEELAGWLRSAHLAA